MKRPTCKLCKKEHYGSEPHIWPDDTKRADVAKPLTTDVLAPASSPPLSEVKLASDSVTALANAITQNFVSMPMRVTGLGLSPERARAAADYIRMNDLSENMGSPKFDRTAYQRDYMRKYRAKKSKGQE